MKKMITFLAFSLQVEIFARVEDETKLANTTLGFLLVTFIAGKFHFLHEDKYYAETGGNLTAI